MGKSSTPMRVLITDSTLLTHPELKTILDGLIEQGHQVDHDDKLGQYHFIAGPNCWYCVPQVAGLFDLALKQGRKIASVEKKALPKKEKKAKVKKPSKTAAKLKKVVEGINTLLETPQA